MQSRNSEAAGLGTPTSVGHDSGDYVCRLQVFTLLVLMVVLGNVNLIH